MHRNAHKNTTEWVALHSILIESYELLGNATKYYLATISSHC